MRPRKPSAHPYAAYREAIINDRLHIRSTASEENTTINTIEISIDNKSWIKLYDFLLNNNWGKTLVAAQPTAKEPNIKPHEISEIEQSAVLAYVEDAGPYRNIKNLFNPDFNLEDSASDKKFSLATLKKYLKLLIYMQSAYNKAALAKPNSSIEVYRNIEDAKGEIVGDINKSRSVIIAQSVASTTRSKIPYSDRKVKLAIRSGSDAIPLHEIITSPRLLAMKVVIESEQENFMGVRPVFISLGKKINDQEESNQNVYDLVHVSRKTQAAISKLQNAFFKRKKRSPKKVNTSMEDEKEELTSGKQNKFKK